MRKVMFRVLLAAAVIVALGVNLRISIPGRSGDLTRQEATNRCSERLLESGPLVVFTSAHATLSGQRWTVRGKTSAPFNGYRCSIDNVTGDVLTATYLRDGTPVVASPS